MSLPTDEELERRYRDLFENEVVQRVVDARTPNDSKPADEGEILDFVRGSDAEHAGYVRSVFRHFGDEDPATYGQ